MSLRGCPFTNFMLSRLLVKRGLYLPYGRKRPESVVLGEHEWWLPDLADELEMPRTSLNHWYDIGWVHGRKMPGLRGRLILWADDKEVDRLKTNFLSIVSHELRTPLTSIIGFVRLVEEEKVGPITPPQCDLLKRVSHHAAHLQSMVNDLLEIAEVEAGGMIDVELEAVDPLAAFYNILPKIETRRGSKNITIEPVIRNTVPLIRCDSLALERIYYHLLDNAVKFIPSEGRVTVEFDRRDNELNISIVDTGIGISHENLTRIFDHFYQVDSRLERTYGGMGIG
ncbi:MAG: HAMP domain-containing sensor histidine kinase, partial [Planctomycetota bacterium]